MSRRLFASFSPTTWVTVQTLYTQLFAIGVFAIQAPLLGPHAFGLIAIVMVLIGFCESVLADSTTETLISVRDIDPGHYATMNSVVVFVSTILGAGLILLAEPLAGLFHEPQLAAVLRPMALLPLVSSLACAPTAATKRRMEFMPLTVRMTAGITAGGVVGIVLTLTGAGIWALVWQAIVQRVVSVAVLWINSRLPLRLSLSSSHWRELAGFAGPLVLSKTMAWAAVQLPRFILGLSLTVTDLGLYSLAARLSDILREVMLVPPYAVARVALRRFLADRTGLDEAARALLRRMSAFCFPLCLGGAVLAPTLIHVWLNPKWFGAIVPAQLLLLSCVSSVSFYGGGALFMSQNQQHSEALVNTLQTVSVVLVVLVFGPYGLGVVTLAMAVRPFLLIPLEASLVRRKCGVSARVFLGSQLPSLCAAGGSAVMVLMLRERIDALLGAPVGLLAGGLLGLVLYALLLRAWAPGDLRQIMHRAHADT